MGTLKSLIGASVVAALGGLLFGLAAYFFVRWLSPEIAVSAFTNLIGAIAVVGAVVGAWLGKKLGADDKKE